MIKDLISKIRKIVLKVLLFGVAVYLCILSLQVIGMYIIAFTNKKESPSIEKNGLEGCDTVPLADDKQQLAEAFMANVDAKWIKLNKLGKEIELPEVCDSVKDPLRHYTFLCYRYHRKGLIGDYERLTIYPSKFYKAFTHLVLYNKDKLLCMAFIVLRNDLYNGFKERPPHFKTYVVIGKRKNINDPFKIFVRGDGVRYDVPSRKIIKYTEEHILYDKGATYRYFDVYPVTDTDSLPLPSDPDFFEKHPLFEKFDDSTYNFEWYKTEGTPEKYYRYDYPY